ncbi:MAG: sulfite exporter TauE/SafE family protein [Cardiobacteriaceae bacterium]|nr:sulfite exporter TauE/SafE family protein [Cardiobacteriaceae bacterium]
MSATVLLTAFATGIAGSAHCVTMCGGISVSLGLGSMQKRLLPVYHIGRLISYATLGIVFGSLFPLLGIRPENPNWGVGLRIVTALIMGFVGVQIIFGVNLLRRFERYGARLWKPIALFVQTLLPVRSGSDALLLGFLWGLLPCGLIYSALALAVVSSNPLQALFVMCAFGLGTLPAMLLLGVFSGTLMKALISDGSRMFLGFLVLFTALWTLWPLL